MPGVSKSLIKRIKVNNAIQADASTQSQTAVSAQNAVSASYALTASFALNGGGGGGSGSIDTSSFVTTSSFNSFTGSYNTGSFTGSFTGSLLGTASWATNATTASFLPIGTYAITASWANNSSQALTSSFLPIGTYNITASWAQSASQAFTASFLPVGTYNITASQAQSSSQALTSSLTTNANNIFVKATGSVGVHYIHFGLSTLGYDAVLVDNGITYEPDKNQLSTGTVVATSFVGTASWAQSASNALLSQTASFLSTGTYNITSSWATNALTASFLPVGTYNITSSWAQSASNAVNSQTASFLPTGTYQITSSWAQSSSQALTASYTPNALVTASVSSNTLTFTKGNGTTFNLTVNTGSGGGSTSPGGVDTYIQMNSGSSFAGYGTFIYDYLNNRVNYNNSIDPYSPPLTNNNNNSVEFFNSVNNIQVNATSYQFTTAQFPYCKYITAQATDKIISLDTNAGTGLGPGLKMQSFKCDYTLSSLNVLDVLVATSKVGTLYCTWDEDNGTYNPVITDTATTSPGGLVDKLDDAAFTVAWNGANVELTLDLTLVNAVNVIFNGVFTIFSMK